MLGKLTELLEAMTEASQPWQLQLQGAGRQRVGACGEGGGDWQGGLASSGPAKTRLATPPPSCTGARTLVEACYSCCISSHPDRAGSRHTGSSLRV